MGKLIVIEGLDSSGKETQTRLLFEHLLKEKHKVRRAEFPNYKSDSSALVKLYLSGAFGDTSDSVGPYAASVLYTVDRFATFRTELSDFYESGGILLCDRYTTSNMIHQACKIDAGSERDAYLDWLCDFEYRMFGLPQPDAVLFLDMPPDKSRQLMEHRANKFTGGAKKDIHEKDFSYLLKSYEAADYAARKYGWTRIPCVLSDVIRSIESIQQDILEAALPVLDAK